MEEKNTQQILNEMDTDTKMLLVAQILSRLNTDAKLALLRESMKGQEAQVKADMGEMEPVERMNVLRAVLAILDAVKELPHKEKELVLQIMDTRMMDSERFIDMLYGK